MSHLPDGWAETTLEHVADVVRGVTYDKREALNAPADGFLPILRATNIEQTLNLQSETVYVPARRVRADQRVRLGDILIAASSGSLGVVGKSAPLLAPWEGGFGAFCAVVRPRPQINAKYISHFVSSPRIRATWRNLAQGTNINNLKGSDLATTVVPMPPLAEQERIVAVIEEEFSRLDAGVAALARSRDCLAVLESATLESLLTRSPDPGAVWETRALSDLTAPGKSSIKAGPFGSVLKKSCYSSSGYKIYGQEQVIKGDARYGDYYINATKYTELATCAVKAGDVLVSLVGSYGKCLVLPEDAEPGIINPRLVKISVDKSIMDPYFLQLVVQSPVAQRYFAKRAYGATMGILNTKILRSLPVPVPALERQRAVIVEWRALSESLVRLRQAIGAIGKREQALRSSILGSAFAGALVPQDPTDEPASALLERIAAERASSNGHNPTRARKPRTKVSA
jgi:type I restriction enzyme S subunit